MSLRPVSSVNTPFSSSLSLDPNSHDTGSYGRDDLPLVAKPADQAHAFIFEHLAELKSEQSE